MATRNLISLSKTYRLNPEICRQNLVLQVLKRYSICVFKKIEMFITICESLQLNVVQVILKEFNRGISNFLSNNFDLSVLKLK